MKYDKASAMAGSSKKKGAAQESPKQQKEDLVNDMEGGMKNAGDVAGASKGKHHKKPVAKKKGGAKHHGNMDSKKGATDHKEGHKGGAQYKEGGADHKEGHKGSANYKEGYPPAGSGKKKGASKKKGAAGFNSHTSDTHKHPHPEGPSRMGFTQNFGPARQNSYARGAAKVAKIMGYGAASKGHGMDNESHTHKDPTGRGDDRVFRLDRNSGSNIGDKNESGYTTDFKPQHKDLGIVGRFENQTYMSSVGGSGATYPGDHLSQVQSTGGPKGSVNKRGQVNPGFNLFSPSNSIDKKDLTQGAYVRDSRSGRPAGDGDTILTDYNQDGTMLGRGINAIQSAFGYGKSKTDTSTVYPKKS